MANKRKLIQKAKDKGWLRFLPWRFIKLYVYPLTVRKKKKPYEAKDYFQSYYSLFSTDGTLTDQNTIGTGINEYHSAYHYNIVENNIFRHFVLSQTSPDNPVILDIGSGAGHWIDFYKKYFNPSKICSFEISDACYNHLGSKYTEDEGVEVFLADITNEATLNVSDSFDIINAIGVIFHITDDQLWQKAITNMAKLLKPGGIMFIGGAFGLITQNVEFSSRTKFDTVGELKEKYGEEIFVTKRVRSLQRWKSIAQKNGLKVERVVRSKNASEMITPENNILVLRKVSE